MTTIVLTITNILLYYNLKTLYYLILGIRYNMNFSYSPPTFSRPADRYLPNIFNHIKHWGASGIHPY